MAAPILKITAEEKQLLGQLRQSKPAQNPPKNEMSLGQRVSDRVATIVGSWTFILTQSTFLALWIVVNLTAWIGHWDPYPFILLNLVLSFQAAFTAPIIMMSQNRQSEIDRQHAEHDYQINVKAELEIELIHEKLNLLQEKELAMLIQILRQQQQSIDHLTHLLEPSSPRPPGST